jgi:hypothetical protein
VDSFWTRFRLRLLPALLTAIGVALLANGLLAYTNAVETPPDQRPPASFEPLPTFDDTIVLPGASLGPDATPTFPPGRLATRIVVPRLDIDLPIVLQTDYNPDYPLCDVAMYLPLFGQPGQGRATYIYAHAREGMFLPLLTASTHNDGARMLGMTVEVYTSDNQLFLYTITEVNRHTRSLNEAINTTTERLFMQTSEGPNGTIPKLQVVADYLSTETATAADSHPRAHPRVCH